MEAGEGNMTDKLPFNLAEPQKTATILPIPMSRDKWFELAQRQNAARVEHMQAPWPEWKLEEVWTETHG